MTDAAIHTQADLDAALAELGRLDPEVIAHLLEVGGPPPLRRRPAGFDGLVAMGKAVADPFELMELMP